MDIRAHLLTMIRAAIDAGSAIINIYYQDFAIETKEDSSPLTIADKKSHQIIISYLNASGIPILSEEGKNIEYSKRKNWEYLWIVDPLDGTKEFIKKNDEFTVNIALVHRDRPVSGVIYVPVFHRLYFAADQMGAYRLEFDGNLQIFNESMDDIMAKASRIKINPNVKRPYTIVGSRSHATSDLREYVDKKRQEYGDVEFISSGSSLKFCQVAEGKADVYPRLGPTMEWDTAAGQLIAEQAGAFVFRYDTDMPLVYNKEDLKNPWFIVSNGKH